MGLAVSERGWFNEGAGEGEESAAGRGGGNGAASTLQRVRRRGPLVPTIIVLVVLGVLLTVVAQVWTEVLWFDSVGFRSVFTTALGAKLLLGVVAGVVTAALVGSSLVVAFRSRPIYVPDPEQDSLERYREAIEPLRRLATVGVPVVIGLLTGLGASAQWETWLLWLNRQSFGQKDPQFGLDLGFFVFTLPWLQFVIGLLTTALVVALVAAAFTHYVFGGLQFTPGNRRTTQTARVHLSALLAAIILLRAAGYWLDRYSLTTKTSDLMTGIQYTDATAVLPTKALLSIASIVVALMFLTVIWLRSWRLPLIGLVSLVVVAIVVGGIVPALIQSLRVKPSEQSLEAPYLTNNIKATRDAYGIAGVDSTVYNAATTATSQGLRNDAATVPGIRLTDPNVVSPTFQQLQALGRNFYRFPDTLDVDRYAIDGTTQDTVIGARELDLDGVPAGQRNWLNDHAVYTHGYGLVAAYGNRKAADGGPVFLESSVPVGKGQLGSYEPRIYFGEQSSTYSIVGAPTGGAAREFDYPVDSQSSNQAQNTYAGTGGVAIGSTARRLAYAIKYREPNFFLSDAVNGSSRLLDYRTPRERIERVAPWLTLDGNAYPAVVDGRVTWILDGYTTTASYPNSRLTSIDTATADSITTTRSAVQAIDAGQINYIRNSVKATVDAFDGSVHLYTWDETDPLLKAWSAAFPGTVEPLSAIPASLMSHLRYPEDLFKVQRTVLARYHVTDPGSLYQSNDLWDVPTDPTKENVSTYQPPYYLSLAMPGQPAPAFSLTSTYKPYGPTRDALAGFLAVDSDAGTSAGTRAADYGRLRLLQLPRDLNVNGPGQVQNVINTSNETQTGGQPLGLSSYLTSVRSGGSTVVFGNLLTLPVGGGLLYVEPIYVQGTKSSSYPLNQLVVTIFGNKLTWSATLSGALDALFPGGPARQRPTSRPPGAPPVTAPGTGTGTGNNAALAQALADAQKAVTASEAALKAGDFTAYGKAQTDLKAAITKAAAAAPTGAGSSTPTTTPVPTATPTG